jgi:mxaK protein
MADRTLSRALRTALLAASCLAGGALVVESWRLASALRVNQQLAGRPADTPASVEPTASDPRVWIAVARQSDHAGRVAEAAALLRRAADASSGELRGLALYDLGNVYLREALRLRDAGADASALPVFELAKQSYRAALFQRRDLWDAKFNLELALRAAPDADPDDLSAPQVPTGERAVTTMRAFTLGLP